MPDSSRVLLLVGSPKKEASTSASLGTYLLERLAERGMDTGVLHVYAEMGTEEGRQKLLRSVEEAHLLVLAFPLYVDCQPAAVIEMMELIHQARSGGASSGGRLMVIINCGFPEAHHNDTALLICRRFAREAGLAWAGGLSLGGGGVISGRKLSNLGGMTRRLRKALDLAAAALAAGEGIPPEAERLMARPMVPTWLYLLLATNSFKVEARRNRVSGRLYDRPHTGDR